MRQDTMQNPTLDTLPYLTLRQVSDVAIDFGSKLAERGFLPLYFYLADGTLACIANEDQVSAITGKYGEKHGLDPNDLLDEPVYPVPHPDISFEQAKENTEAARQKALRILTDGGLEAAAELVKDTLGIDVAGPYGPGPAAAWVGEDDYHHLDEEEWAIEQEEMFEEKLDTLRKQEEMFEETLDALRKQMGYEEDEQYPPHITPEPGLKFIWNGTPNTLRVIVKRDPNLGVTARPIDEVVNYVPSDNRASIFCAREVWNDMVARGEITILD